MFEGQRIIPAISSHQNLKKFLKMPLKYGILMNFQLAQLEDLVTVMHQAGKKVLIHSELIRGLSADEYGAIFLAQTLKVDGIISSKPKVIDVCKKRNIIGIMRMFLKDTHSLKQSIGMVQHTEPECIEVLPAVNTELVKTIKGYVASNVLLGGLIQNEAHLKQCLNAGACAVTTSKVELWNIQFNNE